LAAAAGRVPTSTPPGPPNHQGATVLGGGGGGGGHGPRTGGWTGSRGPTDTYPLNVFRGGHVEGRHPSVCWRDRLAPPDIVRGIPPPGKSRPSTLPPFRGAPGRQPVPAAVRRAPGGGPRGGLRLQPRLLPPALGGRPSRGGGVRPRDHSEPSLLFLSVFSRYSDTHRIYSELLSVTPKFLVSASVFLRRSELGALSI